MDDRRPKLTAKECDWLRWLKQHAGYTNAQLAEKFNVGKNTVTKVLVGEYRPADDYDNPKEGA